MNHWWWCTYMCSCQTSLSTSCYKPYSGHIKVNGFRPSLNVLRLGIASLGRSTVLWVLTARKAFLWLQTEVSGRMNHLLVYTQREILGPCLGLAMPLGVDSIVEGTGLCVSGFHCHCRFRQLLSLFSIPFNPCRFGEIVLFLFWGLLDGHLDHWDHCS